MRREWLEKDYYAALGVEKDAAAKQIKKAYRKLAQQYHPDANPGDKAAENMFKEINEAYDVLSDPEQRKEYDHAQQMGPFVGGPGGTQRIHVEDLSDMFGEGGRFGFMGDLGDLLRGRPRRAGPDKGQDLTADVSLTFHEALNGITKTVSTDGRRTKVKIPAGVANNAKIRVRGKGAPGPSGGPAGDLLVVVHVAEHPIFKRKGSNLRVTVPITFTEAALGAEFDVPTVDGKVRLRIPPGTKNGRTFRVGGQGFPNTKGGQGDLMVTVEVQVPKELSEEERGLLEKLHAHRSADNPRAHLGV